MRNTHTFIRSITSAGSAFRISLWSCEDEFVNVDILLFLPGFVLIDFSCLICDVIISEVSTGVVALMGEVISTFTRTSGRGLTDPTSEFMGRTGTGLMVSTGWDSAGSNLTGKTASAALAPTMLSALFPVSVASNCSNRLSKLPASNTKEQKNNESYCQKTNCEADICS